MTGMPTTTWSLVLKAAAEDPAVARRAITALCDLYREPVRVFFHLECGDAALADDLTQDLFVHLVEHGDLARADPHRGRFRNYLLGAARHRLLNEMRRVRVRKEIPLTPGRDGDDHRPVAEPASGPTPEEAYHAAWVRRTIGLAIADLTADYERRGALAYLHHLLPCLAGDRTELPYAEIAARFEKSEGAVKNEVWRLRSRFQSKLRDLVATTTADEEIEDELRDLAALRRWRAS